MKYTKLGKSDLTVSRICMGSLSRKSSSVITGGTQ